MRNRTTAAPLRRDTIFRIASVTSPPGFDFHCDFWTLACQASAD